MFLDYDLITSPRRRLIRRRNKNSATEEVLLNLTPRYRAAFTPKSLVSQHKNTIMVIMVAHQREVCMLALKPTGVLTLLLAAYASYPFVAQAQTLTPQQQLARDIYK
jgi:hypothetical protein